MDIEIELNEGGVEMALAEEDIEKRKELLSQCIIVSGFVILSKEIKQAIIRRLQSL